MSSTGNSSQGTGTGGRKQIPEFAARLIGTTLDGRFRIDKAIGQGAMGTVFAATQLSVNRRVAVKVLREQISDTSKKRFMREARAISSMNHPNIVQLVEFGEREDGLLFLVMEYVEGLRMSRLNKKGRLHPNLVIELVAQICSALAEAHSHGIVHRDLKPSNILLVITADGSVQLKVLDFGVAHTYEDAAELTATGVLCGTPAYMAPEQARGKNVTPSVDLYALGVNMYQMLCGFRPFRGATPVEVAMKQIQAVAPSLRQYVDQNLMPAELVQLAERLMAKEPELRPQTASEVRQRVLQIRRDFGWGPLVFDTSTSDVWSRWTQQRLAEHGGRPLREEIRQSKSWSGSWSGSRSQDGGTGSRRMMGPGSQAALHDASGVRPPADRREGGDASPEPEPEEQPTQITSQGGTSRGGDSGGISVSRDGLPSRHGGGWDAFRDQKTFPSGAGSVDPHVLEPEPSHLARPEEVATPSEETAHIYDVANEVARASGAHPSPGRPTHETGSDRGGEHQAMGPPTIPPSARNPVPPSNEPDAEPVFEDTSASYQEIWQPSTSSPSAQEEKYEHLSTLVADKPAPREGTRVSDVDEDSGPSRSEIVRFALIAVMAFGVFLVLGYFVLRESPSKTNDQGSEPVGAVSDPAGDEAEEVAREPDGQSEEEAQKAARRKKTPKKGVTAHKSGDGSKETTEEEEKPESNEPIDLFDEGEVGDDQPNKKIIIEEKR